MPPDTVTEKTAPATKKAAKKPPAKTSTSRAGRNGAPSKSKTVAQLRGSQALTTEQLAEVRKTEEDVMALRVKGLSFAKIDKTLDISNSARVFRRAIQRAGENQTYVRAEAIRLEAERMDALQEGIWDRAVNGDSRAVEVALRILERRANMFGLDFQHLINAKAVEIEASKVKMMSTALTKALEAIGADPAAKMTAVQVFLGQLAIEENPDILDAEILG
jgi:hypothetical protein